jgi:hypothetical protein
MRKQAACQIVNQRHRSLATPIHGAPRFRAMERCEPSQLSFVESNSGEGSQRSIRFAISAAAGVIFFTPVCNLKTDLRGALPRLAGGHAAASVTLMVTLPSPSARSGQGSLLI